MKKFRDIVVFLAIIAAAFQSTARPLITAEAPINLESMNAKERESIDTIRKSKNTVRMKLITLDGLALDEDEIIAPGPKGKTVKIKKRYSRYTDEGYLYWVGKVESGGDASFLISNEMGASGAIRTPDGIISIRPLNKQFHLLIEIDPNLIPMHSKEHPSGAQIDHA